MLVEWIMMRLYWRQSHRRETLILDLGDGNGEEIVGGVRETSSGFDAFARTFGYDPGRAQKGIPTLEEGKGFVESFTPWDQFPGTDDLTIEAEVQPAD